MLYEEIHYRAISRANEGFGADDKIDALDYKLLIFLLRSYTWRCRFAQKVVWGRNQLHLEIDFWRTKAFFVEHVQVSSTNKLAHGTSRKCRGASVRPALCLPIALTSLCPVLSIVQLLQKKQVS